MKKIIAFLSFSLLFVGSSAFAFVSWNTDTSDCRGSGIGNVTTGAGISPVGSNGCWNLTNVSANAGNTINVQLYYHNTGNQPATNTKVYISVYPALGQASTVHTFTSSLTSDLGGTPLGVTQVTFPVAQALTPSSTYWYPSQSSASVNGSQITTSSGLFLGTLNQGWSGQGSVISSFVASPVAPSCSISYFNTSPTSITAGVYSVLTWNTENCTSVSISPNIGNVNYSGSKAVFPNNTTSYVITASGANGIPQARSIQVNVNPNYNNYIYSANTNPNYNYGYDCSISYFNASPNSINFGGSSMLNWSTNNCSSVSISNLNYNVPISGSQIVYPIQNTTYTLTAYGLNGSQQQAHVQVFVAPYVPPVAACAVSTVSTNINQNSATLNGMLTRGGNFTNYFEYGTTVNLGSQTISRSSNGSTLFSDVITGLNPETIYYFRLISDCQNGTSKGDLKVFETLPSNVKPVVVQGTTVVGTSSPVALKIENSNKAIVIGDSIYYTVTYKNIGGKKLISPIIQVVIPDGVTYVGSSRGVYGDSNKTLNVPIEDLNGGDTGIVYVEGRLDFIKSNTREIVTTAILVYTNEKGTQENAMAYVLNNAEGEISNNSSLSANVIFSGFFGIGLIGFLLLIIAILLLILVIRKYFYQKSDVNTNTNTDFLSHH